MGYKITYGKSRRKRRIILYASCILLFVSAFIVTQTRLHWDREEAVAAVIKEADSLRKAAEIFCRDILLYAKDLY